MFTKRQLDVMFYLKEGMKVEEMAEKLGLTVQAVKFHLTGIYRLLRVRYKGEAIVKIITSPDILKEIEGHNITPTKTTSQNRCPVVDIYEG